MARQWGILPLLCALAIGGLAGCGQSAPGAAQEETRMPDPTRAQPADLTPLAAPVAADPAVPTPPAGSYRLTEPFPALVQGLVDAAKANLAGRLKTGADIIEVLQVDGVVWPDRSLGCPQPGRAYP
ncbi:MAG: hypothetical protein WCI67_02190 [Chloroflexales bacterium]